MKRCVAYPETETQARGLILPDWAHWLRCVRSRCTKTAEEPGNTGRDPSECANHKHIPIGCHGRAPSVRASGIPVQRPLGQTKAPDAAGPSFGPCRRLDCELELGVWIGPGNGPGEPIPVGAAAERIAGCCLLNDWSARDFQAWEHQPPGPFTSKNFASSRLRWAAARSAASWRTGTR